MSSQQSQGFTAKPSMFKNGSYLIIAFIKKAIIFRKDLKLGDANKFAGSIQPLGLSYPCLGRY